MHRPRRGRGIPWPADTPHPNAIAQCSQHTPRRAALIREAIAINPVYVHPPTLHNSESHRARGRPSPGPSTHIDIPGATTSSHNLTLNPPAPQEPNTSIYKVIKTSSQSHSKVPPFAHLGRYTCLERYKTSLPSTLPSAVPSCRRAFLPPSSYIRPPQLIRISCAAHCTPTVQWHGTARMARPRQEQAAEQCTCSCDPGGWCGR